MRLLDAKQLLLCLHVVFGIEIVVVCGWFGAARAHLTATALKNLFSFYQYVEFLRDRPARDKIDVTFSRMPTLKPKFDAVIDLCHWLALQPANKEMMMWS